MTPAEPSSTSTPSAFDVVVEATLLAGLRAGERRAQAETYRRFSTPVYTLLRRMCGCPDAAADLLQDTFLHAFDRLDQFRGEAPFGRWLRAIAASKALMHLRAGRRDGLLFRSLDDTVVEAFAEAPDPLAGRDLETALALLDAVPRAVLWLYHVEGYGHAEIGAMCGGKTASFSKSQLSRAHQRLRSVFEVPERAMPAGTPS